MLLCGWASGSCLSAVPVSEEAVRGELLAKMQPLRQTQLVYNEEFKELQVQQTAAAQQVGIVSAHAVWVCKVAQQRACIVQQAFQAKQQAEATARQAGAQHSAWFL